MQCTIYIATVAKWQIIYITVAIGLVSLSMKPDRHCGSSVTEWPLYCAGERSNPKDRALSVAIACHYELPLHLER